MIYFRETSIIKIVDELIEFLPFQSDAYCFLVYTHMCERLSAMQRQARLPEFFDHFTKNTYSWLAKNISTPTEI